MNNKDRRKNVSFKDNVKDKILLEWANGVENSPFTQEDLEVVEQLTKTPIKQILF